MEEGSLKHSMILKKAKNKLEEDIKKRLLDFEEEFGPNLLYSKIEFSRYNGSNTAFGKITTVNIYIKF